MGAGAVSIIITAVVASGSTALIYWWMTWRRRQFRIATGNIRIRADILESTESRDDSVVGRSLRYLEAKRGTDDLLVFFHGLGLDANDFRAYLAESKWHCIAVTLFGFNTDDQNDRYPPISLQAHLKILSYGLAYIKRMYPAKRITLVGFSFGADMLLFLPESFQKTLESVDVHRVVLLDPNVNRSTTTISSRITQITPDRPLGELAEILRSATDTTEFRYLAEYLCKIAGKNFAQVQRHAADVVARWSRDSHEPFLDYVSQLVRLTGGVHVVFSFNYHHLFNTVAHRAAIRGLESKSFECSTLDHFELISPDFLKQRLEGVL
ncbi:MAG: alpha/beta hydrolase [Dactylosporangium sp.]|nr:alpha/beta hydrolase [Dactylosporangium sp.]